MSETPQTPPTSDDVVLEGFLSAMGDSVSPVKEQLAKIEERIEYHESSARQLRAARTRGHRVLAALDTESQANGSKPGPKSSGVQAANVPAEKTLVKIEEFVREHYPDETFSARQLADREDFQWSYPTVSAGLRELQARSVLALDSHDGPTRLYRVAKR